MSHVDPGPLSSYNSLVDGHLRGYFANTRMRRHLRKAGLVTKYGEIVSENTYRLNMSRKEHKKHVKDMLAQAIVHKTLDLERSRQAEIKKKLEEIAKIELVRRVKSGRQRKRDDDVLPFISPGASRDGSATLNNRKRSSPKRRPLSTPSRRRRPISALSSNYDDDEEVVYLDDEGRPITPAHVDESELRYSSKDPIDSRHLYALDTAALRKYAMMMSRIEQGRGVSSPYLIPQVPLPPKSPNCGRSPRSAGRYRSAGELSKSSSPKRPATALHPAGSAKRHMGQPESMCEVVMRYHGSSLSLAREQFDRRQDILVEQQHCGGNTLTVFKDKLEPDTKFSFISYRHRGYPFSLSIYIDGQMDCRVSTCCEDRHKRGGRVGGKQGHFSFLGISGAVPCYKCQVEKGVRLGNQAPRRKLKRPPQQHEEVVIVETKEEPQRELELKEEEEDSKEEILVPVEDEDEKQDNYEEDFDSSSSESEKDEGAVIAFQPKEARGVDKTTGKVDINDDSSDSDSEQETAAKYTLPPVKKNRKKSSSSSSSLSSSDGETYSGRKGKAPPPLPKEEKKEEIKKEHSEPKTAEVDKNEQGQRKDTEGKENVVTGVEAELVEKPKRKASVSSVSSKSSKASHSSTDDYSDSDNGTGDEAEEEKKKVRPTPVADKEEKSDKDSNRDSPVPAGDTVTIPVPDQEEESDKTEVPDIKSSRVDDDDTDVYKLGRSKVTEVDAEGEGFDKEETIISVRKENEEEEKEKEDEDEKQDAAIVAVNAETLASAVESEDLTKEETAPDRPLTPTATSPSEEPKSDTEKPNEVEDKDERDGEVVFEAKVAMAAETPQPDVAEAVPEVASAPADVGSKSTPPPPSSPKPKETDDSSSSLDSDSTSYSSDDEKDDKKQGPVETVQQTQAVVHFSETTPDAESSQKTESDFETKDGGNDPDNVVTDGPTNGTTAPGSHVFPEVMVTKSSPGSILPLLEASKTTLEIKGVTLNKTQVYEAAEYVEKAKEIHTFNLVNCNIDDDDVQKITEALKSSPSDLVLVNFSLNPLTVGCVPLLINLLRAKPSIEAVVLQGTRLGDEGVSSLVNGLLELHQEKKMEALGENGKIKELKDLDLSDAKVGDEGLEAVCRLLRSDMDIDTLTFSHNQAVGISGWQMLGESLSNNSKLETLTLDHNLIGDEGVTAIAQGLFNNSCLTALDLNDVGISEEGGRTLIELLKRNTTILEITMAENNLSTADIENIQRYIALNKSVN